MLHSVPDAYSLFMKRPLEVRFGRLVATCRKAKGFTQETLADAAQISHSTIREIERGATGASFDMIEKLAETLGVDPSEFFTTNVVNDQVKSKTIHEITALLVRQKESELLRIKQVIETLVRPK